MSLNFELILVISTFGFAFGIYDCGKSTVRPVVNHGSKFIVGGKSAVPYSWPWQVAIMKKSLTSSAIHCGATIIDNQWIMTAAHCVYNDQTPSKYTIKLGVYNQNSNDEPGEQIQNVIEIRIHPDYDSATQDFDVALLKLAFYVDYSQTIVPICLPQQDSLLPPVGTSLVITGWGAIAEGGSTSANLQEASVPLMDLNECNADYQQRVNSENMFCAGLSQGGKDACQGDSGGPIVYYNTTTAAFTQLGIISWGNGCAESNKPGVYSKVSSFASWISNTIQ